MRARIADELWRAVWQYRKQTAISVALMVVAKVATVAVPLVLKQIVDAFSRPQAAALFPVFLVLAYAILRFVGNALNEVRDMVFSRVTLSTVASFTERTFHHLHRMGARFHAQRETGAIVRDVEKGTQGIGFLLGVAIFTIVPTLVEIGSVIAILIAGYSIGFTAIIGATFACYAVYTIVLTRRRVSVQREMNRLEAQSNSRLVDSLLNTDTVKYFATEDAETRRLATVLDRWTDVGSANQRVLSTLHIGQSAVIGAGIAAMMLLAAQYVAVGRMSVGDLVLVNAYIIQVCLPLNTLGFVFRETNDAMVNIERMFAILTRRGTPGEDVDEAGARALVVDAGEVEFDHVDFGYDPARLVLHGVTFRAAPGTTVAIVGGSGSGKSTLAKLLFRLYKPAGGEVRIDGQNLRHVTGRSIREAVGIVPQDTVLFNETIAYNIAYGRPGATRADVVRAARAAQLDEFVERLPEHYDTRVGERGVRLSGGERQRIAIARALLKNPRIVVFDEATSALDARSERAILSELARLSSGRTSIVIAHRLSTIANADLILVMDQGRIVEQGRHSELLERGGMYAKLWALQRQQSELEHVQRRLVSQAVGIEGLISSVVDALGDTLAARRVHLYTVVAPGELRTMGDPGALQQVVSELCRHAIENARPGSRIELRVERRDNDAYVGVFGTDEAPVGLSQRAMQDAEQMLAEFGARLTLMPLDGRLAYVAVLPLLAVVDADDAEAPGPGEPGLARSDALRGLTVMALDDDEAALAALEAALQASGAQVRLAVSGDDALRQLADAPADQLPDVLLCDIVLDDEDGYQVLRRVRQLEAQRRVALEYRIAAIALTGYAHREDRVRALTAGFQLHLAKPVRTDELVKAIRKVATRVPRQPASANADAGRRSGTA